jgi:hypothetical protein
MMFLSPSLTQSHGSFSWSDLVMPGYAWHPLTWTGAVFKFGFGQIQILRLNFTDFSMNLNEFGEN